MTRRQTGILLLVSAAFFFLFGLGLAFTVFGEIFLLLGTVSLVAGTVYIARGDAS